MHKALHILPPDQRNVFAEALAVGGDQRRPVPRFLRAHVVEQRCRCGIGLAQSIGEIRVHAAIFFFQ